MQTLLGIAAAAAFVTSPLFAAEEAGKKHEHAAGETKKVTGEVVDLACYLDHGATGADHADCAKKCITGGLPVGLKAADGKTYLLIGDHAPMNKELAEYAAKTITVEGKVVSHDGINMIENATIQK